MTKHQIKTSLLIGLLLLAPLFGCVSKGNFESMVEERDLTMSKLAQVEAERDKLITERDGLLTDRDSLTAERNSLLSTKDQLSTLVDQTEQQKQQAEQDAAEAKALLARQQSVYDSLKSAFAEEQEQNQVQIEMMKSGIKVNLADEILFSSGSATLNDSGREILVKAAAELKEVTYQMLVAGFTDNIPITSARFPSNWELAGARAASVIRLLQGEGIPAEQMLAMSFGETHPVMDNETPEGRSKNRRIEILLRPVPIELK